MPYPDMSKSFMLDTDAPPSALFCPRFMKIENMLLHISAGVCPNMSDSIA